MAYEPQEHHIHAARRGRETFEQTRDRLIAEHDAVDRYNKSLLDSYEANNKKREKEEKDAAQASATNRQGDADAKLKAMARQTYLANPAATEGAFERVWPEIREELLKRQTIEALAGRTDELQLPVQQYIRQNYGS